LLLLSNNTAQKKLQVKIYNIKIKKAQANIRGILQTLMDMPEMHGLAKHNELT
jgi:hypothetical protein